MVLVADDTIFSPTDQKRFIKFREDKGQSYDKIDSVLYVGGQVIFSVCNRKTGVSDLQILDSDSISDQLLKKRGKKLVNATFIGRKILKSLLLVNESDDLVNLERTERIVQLQQCPNNERL